MTNMKMSKAEKKNRTEPMPMDAPEYPYGLCLHLDKEEIEKLGLGTPKAGSKILLHAMVEVKSVTVSDQGKGKGYKSIDLQITDMALGKGSGEDMKDLENSLYGKKE